MSKPNNPQALKLYDSLVIATGQSAADAFADALPLSKSAGYVRKFEWAEDACSYLEKNFEVDTITQIRMKCYCNESIDKAQKMKAVLTKSKDLDEFAEKYNQSQSDSTIEIIDGQIYFCYPQCYCSAVKRVDMPLSRTWCLCTLGFAQSLFEKVFGCKIKAELIESIKTGGKRCVVKIRQIS